jgi:anti-anti-sigma regulatory factor
MASLVTVESIDQDSLVVDHDSGVSIVTIAELNLREHLAQIVGNRLLELAHHCEGRLLLKLDLVREFSVAWINELLRLSTHCSGLGGRLVVQGMSEEGVRIMHSTGLDKRVTLVNSDHEARKACGLESSGGLKAIWNQFFGGDPSLGASRAA